MVLELIGGDHGVDFWCVCVLLSGLYLDRYTSTLCVGSNHSTTKLDTRPIVGGVRTGSFCNFIFLLPLMPMFCCRHHFLVFCLSWSFIRIALHIGLHMIPIPICVVLNILHRYTVIVIRQHMLHIRHYLVSGWMRANVTSHFFSDNCDTLETW